MRVYLIGNGKHYKIGFTGRSVDVRMKEIQTGSSAPLSVVAEFESEYAQKIESTMHNVYSSYNISNEWFAIPEDEVLRFRERAHKMHDNFRLLEGSFLIKP